MAFDVGRLIKIEPGVRIYGFYIGYLSFLAGKRNS